MKKYLFLVLLFIFAKRAECSTTPPANINRSAIVVPTVALDYFSNLSIKQVQKLAGRKLKLKEKIAVKVYQWKIKNGIKKRKIGEKNDKGQTAMILGIIGLASLFIPYAGGIISLVCTVLALVLGYQAKKEDPGNRKAKTAITLGWIAVGLYVLAAAIVIAVLATWAG
jgi:hypothetical protein